MTGIITNVYFVFTSHSLLKDYRFLYPPTSIQIQRTWFGNGMGPLKHDLFVFVQEFKQEKADNDDDGSDEADEFDEELSIVSDLHGAGCHGLHL